MITKIISGGQTGIDRVGLNVGIFLGLKIGGWAPKYFTAEDGHVPGLYELKEYPAPGYAMRTEQNILDSDATLIFKPAMHYSRGTSLTIKLCQRHDVPYEVIDACDGFEENIEKISKWLEKTKARVLNVAGPRQSVLDQWVRTKHPYPKISYAHKCSEILKVAITRSQDRT
tara:strand:+ start:2854 stop:3366 length:513 start_codon:yes stop_codon:yes gene_type:complete